MIRDLLLDETGDLAWLGGDLTLTQPGVQDTAQRVLCALELHLGEYQLDITAGVPYRTQLLIKNPNLTAINALLREAIESVPGVVRVERLDLTVSPARELTVRGVALLARADGEAARVELAGEQDDGTLTLLLQPSGGY